MNKLSQLEITDKNLVIRVDMNVPIIDGVIQDETRIFASLPSINYALSKGAKVLLLSHLGRPTEGVFDESFSLNPVAERLSNILNQSVDLISQIKNPILFNLSLIHI